MDCPSCQAENRPGRRFCGKCGAALPVTCPSCGFANDPDDAFCGGCGANLEAKPQTAAVKESEPRQAPDTPPTPELESDAVESARRHLTVLFCDMVGSTNLSERLDPEELTELLTAYRVACVEMVDRFGGHVGNFQGDGILIYFGYPQAHEDDAQRAIRAGLGMIAAVDELNTGTTSSDVKLAVRIGINSGVVVAGDIGAGEQRERMAIVGETPNVAARLQNLAEPGTVVIGSSTKRLVEGLFICESLGLQRIKGISEPIEAFQVREISDVRSRFEATLRRGLTPLVGRQEETGVLVKRWDQAKEGEGQVVLISSEPGVGKSRILQNFQNHVEGGESKIVHYVCSTYHRDTPYHPVTDQLERSLGVGRDDTAGLILDKLEGFLDELGLDVPRYGPLLAALLALPISGRYETQALSPEDKKRKTLEALVAVAEALSSRAPLLIVMEDLQWADPSTLEYLGFLIERVQSARILLICAYRADFEAPWADYPHMTAIRLKRLSRKESQALVDGVTGGKALPREVLNHILVRTDGVPLFIEELTKTILEMGVVVERDDRYELTGPLPAMTIPDSLHDSLMARLDRLAPVKEVAQLAAALGRTFSHELLAAVSRMAETSLDQALSRLVDAELVYRRGLAPEVSYEFKHALVQDAAYGSLLRSKRRQLHMEIGQILEQRFPKLVDKNPELLAYHYREADLPEQAIPFAFKAGEAATARYASTEASVHYQSAFDMGKALPASEQGARYQIRAVLKLANVASNRKQFERDLNNLELARSLAEEIDHQYRLCQIDYWTGRTNYVLGHFDLAVEFAEKSLKLAETLGGNEKVLAGPVNLLARVYCLRGEPLNAVKHATRSVKQMHNVDNLIEEAAVSGVLAFACAQHGQHPEAIAAADHGVELAQELAHLPTAAACFMFRGLVNGWFGKMAPAIPDFEQALFMCEKSGDVFRKYLTHGWRGESYLVAGDVESARGDLEQCLALGDKIGTSFHRGAFEAFLAKALLVQGDIEEALKTSQSAVEAAERSAETWARSIALRTAAEIQLASPAPDLDQAEKAIHTAMEIQEERQCRCDLSWSRLVLAQVLTAKGDLESAAKVYGTARWMFQELGIDQGQEIANSALETLGADQQSAVSSAD
jgi:class 3 adenylate cyclase/tetratricopeptide (TPR) repeat protein